MERQLLLVGMYSSLNKRGHTLKTEIEENSFLTEKLFLVGPLNVHSTSISQRMLLQICYHNYVQDLNNTVHQVDVDPCDPFQ